LVSTQHQVNFELWHQEDLARDPEVSDTKIAAVKRAIDVLNQRRNDLIEQLDQFLVNVMGSKKVKNSADLELNSETPGSIIDRLSINALKIFHMDDVLNFLKEHMEISKINSMHYNEFSHLKYQREMSKKK